MTVVTRILGSLFAVALCASCGPNRAARAHRYPVPPQVGSIANDADAFARFAAAVRPDLERDARSAANSSVRKARWFVLALLDALAGDLESANAALDQAAALEPDPAARAMVGLTLRALRDAGDGSFADALERRVAALPIDRVRGELSMLATMAETFSPEVCAELLEREVGPQVDKGTVDIDQAHAIAFQRYAVAVLVPRAADIRRVLAARGIEPLREQEDEMKPVTITGKAANAFLGAVVVDADGNTYFIDGLAEWDAELLGQTVEVTGVPTRKKLAPDPVVDDDGAVSHGMKGSATVLVDPTWKRAP